ncbi:MAG: peptidylprolyl isomerase [Pseudomonadota bacterium]
MLKIKVLCASALLTAAPFVVAQEVSESGEFLDGIAAIVNEGIVLKSQYYRELDVIRRRAELQGIAMPPEEQLGDQVLERLIVNEIQMQRADRMGVVASIGDQRVNQAIAIIAQQNEIPFENFPAFIEREEGMSYREFRETIRRELILNDLKSYEVLRRIRVSEREIEQCIIDLETNVVVNSDWMLSHILLPLGENPSAAEIAEVEAQAEEIYGRLEDGADFRELAARYSKGPTALQGGSLGWLQGQQVPSLFTDILQDMQAGDVSEPFRTSTSIHLVKVDDLRSAVQRSEIEQAKIRHILITPNEVIDDATAQQRLNDARDKIVAGEADFAEQAKLLSDDPGSGNLGGDLGWTETSDFAPEFRSVADAADVGFVTEPFRSQFGWHILEVMDRRTYDNTEELKERNCIVRIRNSKQDEETILWLQRMRDEAFVDKRI